LSEKFQCLHSTVKELTDNQNQLRNALFRKMQVETGVAFASIILNAVSLGAAGPAMQGIANMSIMGQIVDFSDLAHVRKVFKSETIETVESITVSDGIEFGLETAEKRAHKQLKKAIKTQDSAFIITEAATLLSQCYETVSKDVALPSQVAVSEPGKGVDHTKDQTEEPPSYGPAVPGSYMRLSILSIALLGLGTIALARGRDAAKNK
jgi:hypothetical protein